MKKVDSPYFRQINTRQKIVIKDKKSNRKIVFELLSAEEQMERRNSNYNFFSIKDEPEPKERI
jgi:hypothetical protein